MIQGDAPGAVGLHQGLAVEVGAAIEQGAQARRVPGIAPRQRGELVEVVEDLGVDQLGLLGGAVVSQRAQVLAAGDALAHRREGRAVVEQVVVAEVVEGHLRGLRRLQSVGGYLAFADLPGVRSLDGLQALRQLGTFLYLVNLPALESVAELGGLDDAITSLSALASMSALCAGNATTPDNGQGGLQVRDNDLLQELALDPACSFSGNVFHVLRNPALPTAEAEALKTAWCEAGIAKCTNVLIVENRP